MALENEFRIVLLLVTVWTTELACKRLNVSPIIGQIAAGLVVGPALLDLIPHVQALRVLGKLGVMVLVVESGLAVDVREIWSLGGRASLAAATGVLLPTLLSFALYSGVLGAGWKTALAVGAALSPTSLGFSAQLLGEVGELATPVGQLICTAAVIDDVLSLLLLAEVQALGDDSPEWYAYAVPVIASAGSVLVGILATIFVNSKTEPLHAWLVRLNHHSSTPLEGACLEPTDGPETAETDLVSAPGGGLKVGFVDRALEMMPVGFDGTNGDNSTASEFAGGGVGVGVGSVGRGDRVLLAMVLLFSVVSAYLSALVGSSDLLGCFLAGLAFSGVPGVHRTWDRQMKRFSQWGARLFFSATVAFSVPSIYQDGGLLRLTPFWKGLVLTAAAVVGKLAVGLWAGPPLTMSGFSKLGWAMNGRGEFSFFIAQESSDEGLLSAEDYSAVVWALLLCSTVTPLAFRRALAADRKAQQADAAAAAGAASRDDSGRGGSSPMGGGTGNGVGVLRGVKAEDEGVPAAAGV